VGKARNLSIASLVLAIASLCLPSLANAATEPVVVIMKEGTSVGTEAANLGVAPTEIFSEAVTGFSGELTATEEQKADSDPNVLMVIPDRRFRLIGRRGRGHSPRGHSPRRPSPPPPPPAHLPPVLPTYGTPITAFRQITPPNLARVGLAQSPTAHVDGRDDVAFPGVAVIDTGVQTDNPELNVAGGANCSDEPGPGYGDVEGHGTEVAAVLAAEDNGFGVVGMAPGAPVYSVRVFDAEGFAELSDLICGLEWVLAHRNLVRVVNLSLIAGVEEEGFGTEAEDHACGLRDHDPLHLAICKLVASGVTVVAGAGNEAEEIRKFIPAGYSQVITVSGLSDTDGKPGGMGGACAAGDPLDGDDEFAYFSNYGPEADIAASATCIYTDYLDDTLSLDEGTSFAAPAVSGAALLLLRRLPWLSPTGVKTLIEATAERDGSLAGDPRVPEEGVLNVRGY
jgi:subtilisin